MKYMIKLEDKKFTIKAFEVAQTEAATPKSEITTDSNVTCTNEATYTKSEVNDIIMNLYGSVIDNMNFLYSCIIDGDRSVADQVNKYIEGHNEGHLPTMHPGQVIAVLKSAGIHKDFELPKTPLDQNPTYVWAKELGEIKNIKIDVK